MKRIRTSEATGQALDWLVTKCERIYWVPASCTYSTSWAKGGSIIDREKISTCWEGTTWVATLFSRNCDETWYGHHYGPTFLIAAMRCYVASKLGDEVDVPEELL